MKQPVLGIVATAIIIAISLGFISLFDFDTFSGWVSYLLICLIPMEIVVGVSWQANPSFAAGMSQPIKGLVLMLVCVVAGAIVAPIYWQVAGAGVSPPAPMLMMCSIVSVVVMFWFSIMFGGWPWNVMIKNPVGSGILMLVACYAVNYALFQVFFDYSFMAGAPVYVASLDPGGLYNANSALVFYVTAIGVLFLLLHFDLWPLTTSASLMKQPVLGIVWTILALVIGGAAFYIGTVTMAMDPMLFLVTVPIPFIFGTIIVLNMLHNSLFASLKQPVKGIANAVAAVVIGTLLAKMYAALAPTVTGNLTIGPPANDFERWLASALLGVTFPFLIFYAEFFKMWPLVGSPEKKLRPSRPAGNPRRPEKHMISLRSVLLTLTVCAASVLAQGEQRQLGSIDFFGHKDIDTQAIQAAIPIHEGDPFPGTRSREAWQQLFTDSVTKAIGRGPTDISFVCCNQAGNYMLYLGLPGSSFAPVPFHGAPQGKDELPASLLRILDQIESATLKAVMSGNALEDRSQGYSLMVDPDARAKQLAFREEVVEQEDAVFRVLASSSSDGQRSMAAEALGYARRSDRQIQALVYASLDPNEGVRNNSIRALGVLVDAFPEVAVQVPAEPFIALLSSGSWEDHNKAAALLYSMTKVRDPKLLESLRRSKAVESLIEMARWRNPGHSYTAVIILARIAGLEEKQQGFPDRPQIEAIVSAVRAQGR